jgi:hypothetical protein
MAQLAAVHRLQYTSSVLQVNLMCLRIWYGEWLIPNLG